MKKIKIVTDRILYQRVKGWRENFILQNLPVDANLLKVEKIIIPENRIAVEIQYREAKKDKKPSKYKELQ